MQERGAVEHLCCGLPACMLAQVLVRWHDLSKSIPFLLPHEQRNIAHIAHVPYRFCICHIIHTSF